jgi:hypothetical protein
MPRILGKPPNEGNETSPRPLRAARRPTFHLNRIPSIQHFQIILVPFRIS